MSRMGVINLLKPPGPTSHDVVQRLRRLLGERKIGHGGTLDPGAAGVLPILVGRATKLMPYLLECPKSYRAEMTLGISTDTQDPSGGTVRFESGFSLSPLRLGDALSAFVGEIEQVPPMTSAVRQGGRRLYELARSNAVVERVPRSVRIYDIHVRRIWPKDAESLTLGSRVLLDITCSRGTYIRTLCHDVGERLGTGAHMSFLVRTAVGELALEDSVTLEEVEAACAEGDPFRHLQHPARALGRMPKVEVDRSEAVRLRQGQSVPSPAPLPERTCAVLTGDELICIANVEQNDKAWLLRPVKVF